MNDFVAVDVLILTDIGETMPSKVTRRMAIANGTCVSFCNQPKARFPLPELTGRVDGPC